MTFVSGKGDSMILARRVFFTAGLILASAVCGRAEEKCVVRAVIGGKETLLKHCAVAFYEGENSVTLYFTETPLSAEEAKTFQMNSYAKDSDSSGKPRTMAHLAFCPGGGKATPDAAAVKSVEMSMNHASGPLLGRQWVFELPRDKEFKIEKLSGDLKLGGSLAGRVTGGKLSDQLKYSWQIDFDLPLPEKAAGAGPGCGS
jgi:hypothetical protein